MKKKPTKKRHDKNIKASKKKAKKSDHKIQRSDNKKGGKNVSKKTIKSIKSSRKVIPNLTFIKKKGDNQTTIEFRQRSFQNKVHAINTEIKNEFDYLLRKNRPKGSKTFKPAKAVVIILKIKKPGEAGYYYTSKMTEPDFVVNKKNIQKRIAETLSNYNNEMADMIDEEYDEPVSVYNVKAVSVRFLY